MHIKYEEKNIFFNVLFSFTQFFRIMFFLKVSFSYFLVKLSLLASPSSSFFPWYPVEYQFSNCSRLLHDGSLYFLHNFLYMIFTCSTFVLVTAHVSPTYMYFQTIFPTRALVIFMLGFLRKSQSSSFFKENSNKAANKLEHVFLMQPCHYFEKRHPISKYVVDKLACTKKLKYTN